MADEQHPNTCKQNSLKNTIQDHDLELSLGLRPIHTSSPRNLPHTNLLHQETHPVLPTSNGVILTKRDEQAIRRHEAKAKRDLKRNSSSAGVGGGAMHNGVLREEYDVLGKRCKFGDFGSSATPPWWGNAGGFRPYQGQNGHLNDGRDGEIRASNSSGSSSGASDNYHSNSASGGTSSDADAGSHSSHSRTQLFPANVPVASTSQIQPCSPQLDAQPCGSNSNVSQPQLCQFSSNQTDFVTNSRQSSTSPEGVTPTSIILQPSLAQPKDGSLAEKESNQTSRSPSPKESKGVMGKPPKPNGQTNQQRVQLPKMPCVSATGNGPNRKTVTGFLYKYTKSEVSIVCVCHGAAFTPAGFVEHAGGVDVEHPLRHIRVVPFALS